MGTLKQEELEAQQRKLPGFKSWERQSEIAKVLFKYWSNLARHFGDCHRSPWAFKILQRPDGVLVVCERLGEEGAEVLFASAEGVVEALDATNSAMAADKWKPSKPTESR